MLNNLRIGMRLILGFTIVIIIFVITGVIALVNLQKINELSDKMYNNPFTVKSATLEANGNIIAVHRAMKDVALSQNSEQLEAAVKSANTYNEKVLNNFKIIQTF